MSRWQEKITNRETFFLTPEQLNECFNQIETCDYLNKLRYVYITDKNKTFKNDLCLLVFNLLKDKEIKDGLCIGRPVIVGSQYVIIDKDSYDIRDITQLREAIFKGHNFIIIDNNNNIDDNVKELIMNSI